MAIPTPLELNQEARRLREKVKSLQRQATLARNLAAQGVTPEERSTARLVAGKLDAAAESTRADRKVVLRALEEHKIRASFLAQETHEELLREIRRVVDAVFAGHYPGGVRRKDAVQEVWTRWAEMRRQHPRLTPSESTLKRIARGYKEEIEPSKREGLIGEGADEGQLREQDPDLFSPVRAEEAVEHAETRAAQLKFLKQALADYERDSPIKHVLVALHLGERVFPTQPRALIAADVRMRKRRSAKGEKGDLIYTGPYEDLFDYHSLGAHRPGCPTCGRISRYVGADQVTPREVSQVVNDFMGYAYLEMGRER